MQGSCLCRTAARLKLVGLILWLLRISARPKAQHEMQGVHASCVRVVLTGAGARIAQVSHLLWGLWGLIQARVSQLPDFDFEAYARQRLEQYRICSAPLHRPR